LSIATKVLVVDLYAVQRAVPARKQSKKHNQKQKKPSKPKTHNHNQTKTRYPEGGTSRAPSRRQRTNRGSGQSRGGNGARRERAKPKQPHTLKAKPSSNRGRDKNKRPTGTRDTTNKKPHRKHKDQKTPDAKGQPEQVEANRPHDTGPPAHHPEKENRQKETKKT
jgi:hypothetical protein